MSLFRILEIKCTYSAEDSYFIGRGRPALNITVPQLTALYNEGFSLKQMATSFGCSVSVVKSRLYAAGLHIRSKYTQICDDELRRIIAELHRQHPNSGSEVSMRYWSMFMF